jgi:hypothetical protein
LHNKFTTPKIEAVGLERVSGMVFFSEVDKSSLGVFAILSNNFDRGHIPISLEKLSELHFCGIPGNVLNKNRQRVKLINSSLDWFDH